MAYFICEKQGRCCPHEFYDSIEQAISDSEDGVPCDHLIEVAPVRHAKWVDNHCTACGMMPMGDEMWKNLDVEPPLFERFMDYCPSCGAKMNLER